MISVTINGKKIELESGFTVLQACEIAGVEIPRFCYHDRLSIAGNCRMCLVEIEGGPKKPMASCAIPITNGMIVHTNTPMVEQARKGVMEFLLINHPLDCPICDQGGECDLQDQAVTYGSKISRFSEYKRSVDKKHFGPLIETAMNRCIHCTRCVRFLSDVAGVKELGAIGRGEDMEISTYIQQSIDSELSGNIIDLCPVGALTSKPYLFTARSWELSHTETIDISDAVGSAIRVDSKGQKVMRVLPRLNEDINEEWISDKSRFSYDGLSLQRLDTPYIRQGGKLRKSSWTEAFTNIKNNIKGKNHLAAIAGDLADCESMLLLKDLLSSIGNGKFSCCQRNEKFFPKSRSAYIFNTTISGIENADLCLLIGTNPKIEAPLINSRIRKSYLNNKLHVANIGEDLELNYPIQQLGENPNILEQIINGQHPFCNMLENSKNCMLIIGEDALCRNDGGKILSLASKITEKYNIVNEEWNGFNVLHQDAAKVGALDVGFTDSYNSISNAEILYLLGADEIDPKQFNNKFVIYQGHHGDKSANYADVILPGAAYTEKNATYVNTEGRAQHTYKAINPPGEAQEDWQVIKNLAQYLKIDLPYLTIKDVRKKLAKISKNFANINKIVPARWKSIDIDGELSQQPIILRKKNFYMTNSICRASQVMASCMREFTE